MIKKYFFIFIIIAVIVLIMISTVYFALQNKNNKITPFPNRKDVRVEMNYEILKNESLWRSKLIQSNIPMQWNATEKNIVVKEIQQNKFFCGDNLAQFIKYSSSDNDSVGGWNNLSVIDCGDYYFIYEFGDAGPKLYGPFDKKNS